MMMGEEENSPKELEAAGSIAVVPAGSPVLWRRQGSIDTLLVLLEPRLVARVAAESFEFDPARTVVPPLDGLNVPELRSEFPGPKLDRCFSVSGTARSTRREC